MNNEPTILMSILAVLPTASLVALAFYICITGGLGENKAEVSAIIIALVALSKDAYGYIFGSSKKGNSS